MGASVYERRKFVRVESNVHGLLNRQHRVAIRRLSLGGCQVECSTPLTLLSVTQLEFSVLGEDFSLSARPVSNAGENQFCLRFESAASEQTMRLANVIERLLQNRPDVRPARLRIVKEALLDQKPSILTNLSEGGCFLRTKVKYHRGDVVEVQCQLDQQEIRLSAQVRWTTPLGIGVQYLSLDATQLRCITEFIARHGQKPTAR